MRAVGRSGVRACGRGQLLWSLACGLRQALCLSGWPSMTGPESATPAPTHTGLRAARDPAGVRPEGGVGGSLCVIQPQMSSHLGAQRFG